MDHDRVEEGEGGGNNFQDGQGNWSQGGNQNSRRKRSPRGPYDSPSYGGSPNHDRSPPGPYDSPYASPPGLYDSPSDEDNYGPPPKLKRFVVCDTNYFKILIR